MVTDVVTQNLKKLPCEISDEQHEAVADLVYEKYLLDRFVAKYKRSKFAGELYDGGYGPQLATSIYRLIFPFTPKWNPSGETFEALVPVSQIIGASWRWRTEHLEVDKREEFATKLSDHINARNDFSDRAEYMWIRPLGLVLPHEGKNRVDFLREMEVEYIPARVTPYDYPESDRLALFEVSVNGRTEYWTVLDDQWVERLAHPEWALPVLRSYGVVEQNQWPSVFPTVEEVSPAFVKPHGHSQFLNQSVVDMRKLDAQNNYRAEMVDCSVYELSGVQIKTNYAIRFGAALGICLAALFFLPTTWQLVQLLAGIGFGVGCGMVLALVFPIIRASRQAAGKL